MKFNINWLSWPRIQPEITDKIIMTEDPLKVLREVRKILKTPEGEDIRVHALNIMNTNAEICNYVDSRVIELKKEAGEFDAYDHTSTRYFETRKTQDFITYNGFNLSRTEPYLKVTKNKA